ncbi:MAG: HAD family hydrolase [Sphingomonadaceae bacterium]|uniref:HAD family hydrolase n=1 Tax=Thermaurantiacus sp. TaxID=2820283 RepID=UPI00298F324D|nr:HAD family hydrolase [Thermaurantiacus sp.]MCS6986366.1 HAD family hydrolase [Sphingomonadaceae bacterium]MDW8414372.1 HAD family hydrolase [Thermaurantiacus sp.]
MRPLLILDCDEVVLRFVAPFRRWLGEVHGLELQLRSFALTGNVRDAAGEPVPPERVAKLVDDFFASGQRLQSPVEGAVEALARLARAMEVVVLTNIADAHRPTRQSILRAHGLDLPVVANAGPKGPMVRALAAGRRAVFVDDLPPHHDSVAHHAPEVGRLHMVAEPELRPLVPAAPAAHARIDAWADAEAWIRTWLEDAR